MPNTNELVLAAQGGDEKAFGQLVLAYQAIAEMAVRSFQGALGQDELLQEVWLRVFCVLDRYSPGTNFRAWLYRVARNTAINMIRRENLRKKSFPTRTGQGEFNEPRDILVALATEEDPGRWLQVTQVDDVMRSLDPKWVEILNLTIVGFSYREIADSLDVPLGTVMSRLFRARQAFMAQAGRTGILAEFMSEVGIIPHSSTQKVGSKDVDVASAKKNEGLDELSRFRSPPERNADALGVALFLLGFVANLAEEAKDKWFHLDPWGKQYPNIARVEPNSFHPVLIGLVRTGWLELSRDKKNKIVIARFAVPHSTLLKWHCYSPKVDDSDVPKDKKAQATENRRRAFEQMLKNDFSAWLTHITQHQLVSEEKRIKYADLLSIALSGKSPPRKPSPEVRVNGNSSPKEGNAPATSGNGEDETMAKNLHKLKKWLRGANTAFLLQEMVQVGAGREPGVLSSDIMPELIAWIQRNAEITVDAGSIGNHFRFQMPTLVSGSGRATSKRWWVSKVGHEYIAQQLGSTEADTSVGVEVPPEPAEDSINDTPTGETPAAEPTSDEVQEDQLGDGEPSPPVTPEPEEETVTVAEEGSVSEVAPAEPVVATGSDAGQEGTHQENVTTPLTAEEVADPLGALMGSFRTSIEERIRTAEQSAFERGRASMEGQIKSAEQRGYDRGHEAGKKAGEQEALRRAHEALKALGTEV